METLQLYNAQVKFGNKVILKEVSFTVQTGTILGIFGRNGSGKSTLLKMLFGSLNAGTVSASYNDRIFFPSENVASKTICYIPQHPFIPKRPKVRDVIPMCFPSEETQDAIFYAPGIAKIDSKRVGELSQGERKYFEVILLGNTKHPFLFLDEPFSMVDPLTKDMIKEFLFQKKKSKGIIVTDHYYDDVLQVTTKNIVLKDGVSHPIDSVGDLQQFEYLKRQFS